MKKLLQSLAIAAVFAFTCSASAQTVTFTIPEQTVTIPARTVTVNVALPDAGAPPAVVDAGAPVVDAGAPVVDAGTVTPPPPPPGSTARPAASKGVGFYVVGSKLYDANGAEFRMRGTNKTHQDNQSPGLGQTKSNTTRWLVYFTEDTARTIRDLQSPSIGGSTTNGKAVAVPGFWDGTCKSDTGTFNAMVNRWVRDAAKYQAIEKYMVLNIANEWGSDHAAWRDAYVAAIPKIRAAGWNGAIMVDAPGCGQDAAAIISYGKDVLAADPQKNVMFDWHIYGNVFDSVAGGTRQWREQLDLLPTMTALKATGLAVVVGEFGPGRNVGPSPTNIKPERIVDLAERHGLGWLSWSWDDNNKAGGMADEDSFAHVKDTGGPATDANLLSFGKVVVQLWNQYATPASIFAK